MQQVRLIRLHFQMRMSVRARRKVCFGELVNEGNERVRRVEGVEMSRTSAVETRGTERQLVLMKYQDREGWSS